MIEFSGKIGEDKLLVSTAAYRTVLGHILVRDFADWGVSFPAEPQSAVFLASL
jgi:hypothetical protein